MSCCKEKMEPVEIDSCCSPRDTAQVAAQTMRKTGCGCAPVVEDEQSRRLVGVVTERDVCHGVATDDRRPSEIPVKEIMRPRLLAAAWMSRLKKLGANSTRIRPRVYPLWTMRAAAAERSVRTTWGKRDPTRQ